jgi:cellulose synthase operon protein C
MVQLYEDQILRGRDPAQRAELARKVARIWEEDLGDAREAADAWRRVLRMKAADPEGTAGLDRAKSGKLKRAQPKPSTFAPAPASGAPVPPPTGVASAPHPGTPPALEPEDVETTADQAPAHAAPDGHAGHDGAAFPADSQGAEPHDHAGYDGGDPPTPAPAGYDGHAGYGEQPAYQAYEQHPGDAQHAHPHDHPGYSPDGHPSAPRQHGGDDDDDDVADVDDDELFDDTGEHQLPPEK